MIDKNNDRPLVTIITACYNGEGSILNAMCSIESQSYPNIQYIIIDGASTDRTLEVVNNKRHLVDVLVSEPDNGIADAWNKGLALAKGELIGFLNADDVYENDVVEKAVNTYLGSNRNCLIYANCCFIDNGVYKSTNSSEFDPARLKKGLGFGFVHTTCFVPKSVYESIGFFSTRYKIAIDTDFLVRCYVNNIQFIKSNYTVYMSLGGVSDRYASRAYSEFLNVLENHNIIQSKTKRLYLFFHSVYSIFRPVFKSEVLSFNLRWIKHNLCFLMNFIYAVIPTLFLKNCYLKLLGFSIGKCSYILKGVKFYRPGNVDIGYNSIVNRDCLLDNRGRITIGSCVSISHHVSIYTAGHRIESLYFDYYQEDVFIGDKVCIFPHVLIQPGSTIGKGAVILPGAVVSGNVEEYGIYGGVPAKKISTRNRDLRYSFNYPFWRAL